MAMTIYTAAVHIVEIFCYLHNSCVCKRNIIAIYTAAVYTREVFLLYTQPLCI